MTEESAEKIFELVEDQIYKLVKNENGFKYLALRKEEELFFLELSYDKNEINRNEANILKDKINHFFSDESLNVIFKDSIRVDEIIKDDDFRGDKIREFLYVKDDNLIADDSFEFYSSNVINSEPSTQVYAGMQVQNHNSGTLGGIIRLVQNDHFYLVSNHHVIAGNSKTNSPILDRGGNKIAELYWSKFDDTHDIAIAKITVDNDNIKSGAHDYHFDKILPPSFSMNSLRTFSANGPSNNGEIYSIRAIIRVENDTFKNQILFKNFGLKGGDSGAIIVVDENKTKKDVIGICIGGDYKIDIANKLSNIFKPSIMMKSNIQFHSFY